MSDVVKSLTVTEEIAELKARASALIGKLVYPESVEAMRSLQDALHGLSSVFADEAEAQRVVLSAFVDTYDYLEAAPCSQ